MATFLTKGRERLKAKLSKLRQQSPFNMSSSSSSKTPKRCHSMTLHDLHQSLLYPASDASSTDCILQDMTSDDLDHRLCLDTDAPPPYSPPRSSTTSTSTPRENSFRGSLDFGSQDCLLSERVRKDSRKESITKTPAEKGDRGKVTGKSEKKLVSAISTPHLSTPTSSMPSKVEGATKNSKTHTEKRSHQRRQRYLQHSTPKTRKARSTCGTSLVSSYPATDPVVKSNMSHISYHTPGFTSSNTPYHTPTYQSSISLIQSASGSTYSSDQRRMLAKRIARMKRKLDVEGQVQTLGFI